ncbi:MAG: septation protein A [Gammaproteobacteria bacterium]|nr:septation protein A [Gammaproteobacteria bacterium]
MKFLFDLLPVIAFFAAYQIPDDSLTGIEYATVAAIIVSALQVAYLWLRHRRVERMYLITFALLLVLGGATLLFHDERFIKWKPTLVNWAFALAFLGSTLFGSKCLIERMMGAQIQLPSPIWRRLNHAWTIFFVAVGGANLFVAYHFETKVWVNFKLFGVLGLTLLFALAQGWYLLRHMQPATETDQGAND